MGNAQSDEKYFNISTEGTSCVNSDEDIIDTYTRSYPEEKKLYTISENYCTNMQCGDWKSTTGSNLNILCNFLLNIHSHPLLVNEIKFIVKFDPESVNHQSSVGVTPLHIALVLNIDENVVKLLLTEKAVNTFTKTARSLPAAYAICYYKNNDIIMDVLKLTKNINHKNSDKNSILHIAVNIAKNLNIIEYILSRKPDVNILNHLGDTPLIRACNRSLKIVKLLLSVKTINVNVVNDEGHTAFDILFNDLPRKITTSKDVIFKEIIDLFIARGLVLKENMYSLAVKYTTPASKYLINILSGKNIPRPIDTELLMKLQFVMNSQ